MGTWRRGDVRTWGGGDVETWRRGDAGTIRYNAIRYAQRRYDTMVRETIRIRYECDTITAWYDTMRYDSDIAIAIAFPCTSRQPYRREFGRAFGVAHSNSFGVGVSMGAGHAPGGRSET